VSLFLVYRDHLTVDHHDLFEYQAIVTGGWVLLDGAKRAI
jgi:hypothetical protein